jgi:hypothetical protein
MTGQLHWSGKELVVAYFKTVKILGEKLRKSATVDDPQPRFHPNSPLPFWLISWILFRRSNLSLLFRSWNVKNTKSLHHCVRPDLFWVPVSRVDFMILREGQRGESVCFESGNLFLKPLSWRLSLSYVHSADLSNNSHSAIEHQVACRILRMYFQVSKWRIWSLMYYPLKLIHKESESCFPLHFLNCSIFIQYGTHFT